MKQVLIFNPDNDLALADGGINYIAPAVVRKMADDLAMLPVWYAPADSYVIASPYSNEEFFQAMRQTFQIDSKLITFPELVGYGEIDIIPWGWNHTLSKYLQSFDINLNNSPSTDEIEELKAFSHRRNAVKLLPKLKVDTHFCGDS